MPAEAAEGLTLAFFDIPYHSRLVTTLPIAQALVERGHRVVVFTLEPYRVLVAATGAEVALQPPFGPEPPDCTVNLRTIDYAGYAVEPLVEQLVALAPDAVIFSAKCLWAAVAADRLGLPTVGIHTNGLWPRDVPLSPRVRALGRVYRGKSPAEIDALMDRDRHAFVALARRFGAQRIEPIDVVPDLTHAMNLRGDVNLVYTSEALQPHREAFGPEFHFVGPCYDRRAADADPSFDAALACLPRPIVYAALGTIPAYNDKPELLRALRDRIADGTRGLIMAVGGPAAVDALGEPGHGVRVRPYVPQLDALAAASLFITHAGTNSAYEALLAGVPMLMLPQAADQFIVAEHYDRLGLGRWHDGSLTDIAARIDEMLDDRGLSERVRAAGETLRAAGGLRRAVTAIEEHLAPS